MKITMTNYELDKCIGVLNNPSSFYNNVDVKLPVRLAWNIRLNMKVLTDRFEIVKELQQNVINEFVKAEKIKEDKVLPDYIQEFNLRIHEVMIQESEFEINSVDKEDFMSLNSLSIPEVEVLMKMVDDKKDEVES